MAAIHAINGAPQTMHYRGTISEWAARPLLPEGKDRTIAPNAYFGERGMSLE